MSYFPSFATHFPFDLSYHQRGSLYKLQTIRLTSSDFIYLLAYLFSSWLQISYFGLEWKIWNLWLSLTFVLFSVMFAFLISITFSPFTFIYFSLRQWFKSGAMDNLLIVFMRFRQTCNIVVLNFATKTTSRLHDSKFTKKLNGVPQLVEPILHY